MKTFIIALAALCMSCTSVFADHRYAGSFECDPLTETCEVAMQVKRTGGTGTALFSFVDPEDFGPISGTNEQQQAQCVQYAEGLMEKGYDDQRFFIPSEHIVTRTAVDWVVCFFVTDKDLFLASPEAVDSAIPGQSFKPVLDKIDAVCGS